MKKYGWVRNIGSFLVLFWTDMVTIFVILECLFFRLSVTMLLFLVVYMVFYFSFFDKLGKMLHDSGYNKLIIDQMSNYASKQDLLEDHDEARNMVADK